MVGTHHSDRDTEDNSDLLRGLADSLSSRECTRPISVERDGEAFQVRCGSRLVSVCPGCSAVAVGDWQAIVRSGLFDVGLGYRFMLLTLTAPSFGAVHRVVKAGRTPTTCRCGRAHHPDRDALLRGVPIDFERYNYDGAVRWNYWAGKLLDNTRARLRKAIPAFEYAAVREWQARGLLHFHILIRVSADQWAAPSQVSALARTVQHKLKDGSVIGWGANTDAREVRADESTGRAVWYLTKTVGYLTKDVADGGGGWSAQGAEHWARLADAARRMRCPKCSSLADIRCRAVCHRQWGARASVVSVSRPSKATGRPGWSITGLTRRRQRVDRAAWAAANSSGTAAERAHASSRRAERAAWARQYLANCDRPQGVTASRHLVGGVGQPQGDSND